MKRVDPAEARARTFQRVHRSFVRNAFRPFQREILDAVLRNRFTAILGPRQVGKTTAVEYGALCLALGIEWEGVRIPAHDVHIVSRSEKHSQAVVRQIGRLMAAFNIGVSRGRIRQDGIADGRLGSLSRIALANGRHIFAHSGLPEAIQGFPGSVIVDEIAANAHDPAELVAQAQSASSSCPYMRTVLIGNASLRGDWWHQFWTSKEDDIATRRKVWALRSYTIHDVFPEGLPEHLEEQKASMPLRDWERWYLCRFVDAYNRAVDDEAIEAAQIGGARCGPDSMTVLGIDPGGHFNPTGIVLARVGGFALDVLRGEYWYGPLTATEDNVTGWARAQLERIDQIVREHRPTWIVVDNTNANDVLGRALRDRYGAACVLVTVTPEVKQREWGSLSALLMDGRISIPRGQPGADLRGDLARLELDNRARVNKVFEMGRLHMPSAVADNGKHILHCDIAAALMLVCEYVHIEAIGSVDLPGVEPRPMLPAERIGVPAVAPMRGPKGLVFGFE